MIKQFDRHVSCSNRNTGTRAEQSLSGDKSADSKYPGIFHTIKSLVVQSVIKLILDRIFPKIKV